MRKDRIEGYINWLNRRHEAKKRSVAAFLAVSMVLSGNVFWLLRNTGVALTDEYICGLTEHTHSDECYEEQLICEDQDPEHVHGEDCYIKVLKCGMEEHSHTKDCCPVAAPSHELQSEWESKLPKPVEKKAQSLVNTAVSQMDYKEEADGYTRYGAWYGNQDGDWNVMFVSFCLHYSKITEKDIPYGSGCWAWQVKLDEKGLINKDLTSLPQMGDIILIDTDGDGKCDRTGIIIDINESSISVIEGDLNGAVCAKLYKISDASLFGYVSVNKLDSGDTEPSAETAETEAPAETSESSETTETSDAAEKADEPQAGENDTEDAVKAPVAFEAVTGSGITVKATAPAVAFPEGTTMTASDVASSKVKNLAEQTVTEGKELKGLVAVDITFFDAEGNKVEPLDGTSVDVNIKIPESRQPEGKDFDLIHIDGKDVSVVKDAEVSSSEAAFTTGGFSIYVLTGTGEKDKDKVHAYISNAGLNVNPGTDLDGDTIKNSSSFPYVLLEGDTVELIGRIDPEDANGENLHIRFWNNLDWMGDVVSITETKSTPTEVRATITGISSQPNGGSCAVSLYRGNVSLTDQDFSIRVIRKNSEANVIDFDQLNNNADVYVNYGDTIVIKGTPNRHGEDVDWPYIQPDENRGILSAFGDPSEDEYGVRSITCRAEVFSRDNNVQPVRFWLNNGVMKTVNVHVNYDYHNGNNDYYEILDHADIEIADGGVYTSVSFEVGDDDGMIKTVTEYQSYVSGVNSCRIYDKNNNPTPFYETSEQNWQVINATPLPTNGFDSDDYWSDPQYHPGDSQYELTSKYHDNYIFNNRHFRYKDVDHVVFDVSLQIAPIKVEKYKYNSSTGTWEKLEQDTVEYTPDYPNRKYKKSVNGVEVVSDGNLDEIVERIDSQVFELDKRYVVDAYNKCPNHSGLDFTVHANSAAVQFGATKELTNGVLHAGDFTFELVDRKTNKVVSEVNNEEGKVIFERLQFDAPGTYKFYIREKDEHDAHPEIRYDKSVYDVTVEVTEIPDSGGMLIANVTEFSNNYSFKFTNEVIYSLPNTGGGGIAPFIVAGTALIGGALILLILKRNREVYR